MADFSFQGSIRGIKRSAEVMLRDIEHNEMDVCDVNTAFVN
jgi:hypothetical protein